jgi:glyoxylase-like metal-dependent hydrolase (beta-lactamase superfamily II)
MSKIQVGEIAVSTVLEDDHTLFEAAPFFPDATPEILAAECAWMAPRLFDQEADCLICTVQGYVFETGGLTVLVDTCVGNDKQGRMRPAWNNAAFPWLDNLAAAGFAPDDIDIVLCTHLHVDHVGWNTRLEDGQWVPTFPNAQYLTTRRELDSLEHRRDHGAPFFKLLYEDSMLPVIKSGQSVVVAADHLVSPGVRLRPTPGHTPGHTALSITSGDAAALCIGDAMHHPIQALYPDWSSRHCDDPELARHTRRQLLEEVCDTATWLLPAHFDPCHVTRRGEAYWLDFD